MNVSDQSFKDKLNEGSFTQWALCLLSGHWSLIDVYCIISKFATAALNFSYRVTLRINPEA